MSVDEENAEQGRRDAYALITAEINDDQDGGGTIVIGLEEERLLYIIAALVDLASVAITTIANINKTDTPAEFWRKCAILVESKT